VASLCRQGHTVFVETAAGVGAGFPDAQYLAAGAVLVPDHARIFEQADLVIKVKEPLPEEYPLLRPGLILFTYLHLAASQSLTEAICASGATAIAYETIQVGRRLPLLEPMSEIAGRMAPIVGGYHLAKFQDGAGVLLSGAPGVLPGKVLILGGGISGFSAAKVAAGLGADVSIFEVDLDRIQTIENLLPHVRVLYASPDLLKNYLTHADLVIGAVLIPAAKAPRLIQKQDLALMKPGSVIIDIAIDQGGCVETSRATTHQDPTYIESGIVHYGVANMPGAYPRTATLALSNATRKYIDLLSNHSLEEACALQPSLKKGISIYQGQLVCETVAAAHGLPVCSLPRNIAEGS